MRRSEMRSKADVPSQGSIKQPPRHLNAWMFVENACSSMAVFNVDPDLVHMIENLDEEGLIDFAALYEHADNDSDVEVSILVQFLLFRRLSSLQSLGRALQQATTWTATAEMGDPDHSRRLHIVEMIQTVQRNYVESQVRDRRPRTRNQPLFHVLSTEFIKQWLLLKDLRTNMSQSDNLEVLAVLTSAVRQVLPLIPQGFQPVVSWLCDTGTELLETYRQNEIIEYLHSAVEVASMSVDAALEAKVDHTICLANLGASLGARCQVLGTRHDRERAIDAYEEALKLIADNDPNRSILQGNLGLLLVRQYEFIGLDVDLDRAISVTEMATEGMPRSHANRAIFLDNLGLCLGNDFRRSKSPESLRRAIAVLEEASELVPKGSPEWVEITANLSMWLNERSRSSVSKVELDQAVETAEAALLLSIDGSQGHVLSLKSLGFCLQQRYERYGCRQDLDRAIEATESVVKLTPEAHPNYKAWLGNLGSNLFLRYEQIGSMSDLDRAIELSQKASDMHIGNSPEIAVGYNNLAVQLCTRFERAGRLEDITSAVKYARMAVEITPNGSPDWPGWSSNLGTCLGRRYERIGLMDDLNSAIDVSRNAVDGVAADHPDRARWLNNYALWLYSRFERHGHLLDISDAIEAGHTAIQLTPDDNPRLPLWQANMAVWLSRRATETQSMRDIDEAVDYAQLAAENTSVTHVDRAGRFNNLGMAFETRYEMTSLAQDLNRAIAAVRTAIDASTPDYPERARHFDNLGNWLLRRFQISGLNEDQLQALSCFERGWACKTASPSDRIPLARSAAKIYASRGDWIKSSAILAEAIELLPLVSPRMLGQNEKQHIISRFHGLASLAAAAALNAGKTAFEALEILEQGRCVISGLLLDLRTDLSELGEQHPALAARFESLRDELDSPTREGTLSDAIRTSPQSRIDQRFEASRNFTEVITMIRALPKFERFLLSLTQIELMAVAHEGPIVLFNVNSYRCDAFIVQRKQIEVLGLPALTEKALRQRSLQGSVASSETLEWLWTVAVCPVLEKLHYTEHPSGDVLPRVWWIPTGALSHFPIHAAGFHQEQANNTVIDRVMSSYSSSLKVLAQSRRSRSQQNTDVKPEEALLVAMEFTASMGSLPYASKEIDILVGLCGSLQLKPVQPDPSKEQVLAKLAQCKVFHFAGHGSTNPTDPSQSMLLLKDYATNPLTVGDIQAIRVRETPPFLGYLSACSTSTNKAERLVDEGINLVNAVQLAGFRHVIGTLWEVSDSHCVTIAERFYKTLGDEGMTDVAVCHGLHIATRTLRDLAVATCKDKRDVRDERDGELVDVSSVSDESAVFDMSPYWIPYVHFGP